MWPYYISNPEFAVYRERAGAARNEAIARAGYLAIEGLARLQAATVHTVGGQLLRAIGSIRAWRERRLALQDMQRLDERMLHDIGLTRADVYTLAHGGTLATDRYEEPVASTPVVRIDVALDAYAAGLCDDGWRQAA